MGERARKARQEQDTARDFSDADAARVAKALGHPARVRIVRLLLEHGECYCGELCEELPLAQSTVSQHLEMLRRAGLVIGAACGRSTGYRVDEGRLEALSDWLQGALEQRAKGSR